MSAPAAASALVVKVTLILAPRPSLAAYVAVFAPLGPAVLLPAVDVAVSVAKEEQLPLPSAPVSVASVLTFVTSRPVAAVDGQEPSPFPF